LHILPLHLSLCSRCPLCTVCFCLSSITPLPG
jgi:hypothetical protein